MKNFIFYLFVLGAAFLFEGTIRHFPLTTIRIDLVWLVVLYLGFYVPLFPGGLSVLILALAQETLAATLHGVIALSYLPVYFFLRLTHHHLFFEGKAAQIIWIVLLTLIQEGFELALLLWQGYTPAFNLPNLLGAALLNGIVSLLLFPFLKKGGNISPSHAS